MKGIDISNWQGGIVPSNLNIDFCICKATEGTDFVDGYCDGFVQNCIENNILWGFYHFANSNEPEAEAQFFYDNCVNYFNHGIPILDYETSNYDNCEWCERFLSKLHELSGVWGMLYISASRCGEYENSWIPSTCGLWVAGYPYEINDWNCGDCPYNIYPWSFAAIWQFTSSLYISGYDGRLDGDIAYMNAEGWLKYAQSNETPTPTPQPQPKPSGKTTDDLVWEVLMGEYGDGDDRIRMLGDRYDEVQNRINELYEIAEQVIRGDWGNGWNREQSLNGAGYPYQSVQYIVNQLMA